MNLTIDLLSFFWCPHSIAGDHGGAHGDAGGPEARIVLWHDPANSITHVTNVLEQVLGHVHENAELMAVTAQRDGRVTVWRGPQAHAEMYCQILAVHGLRVTVEAVK